MFSVNVYSLVFIICALFPILVSSKRRIDHFNFTMPGRDSDEKLYSKRLLASGPADHLITNLPGLSSDENLIQYAGHLYIDSKKEKDAIFYWLFEKPIDSDKAPLVIWLNGGPGNNSTKHQLYLIFIRML